MTEDRTQATVVIALVGGLLMLIGFLVIGAVAIPVAAVLILLWAGLVLGPSRSAPALVGALCAASLAYGVLALGDAVLGDSAPGGRASVAGDELREARDDVRRQRQAAAGSKLREERAQQQVAGVRAKLRSAEREIDRLRREADALRKALRRAIRQRP